MLLELCDRVLLCCKFKIDSALSAGLHHDIAMTPASFNRSCVLDWVMNDREDSAAVAERAATNSKKAFHFRWAEVVQAFLKDDEATSRSPGHSCMVMIWNRRRGYRAAAR